jgi:hypothetical protein
MVWSVKTVRPRRAVILVACLGIAVAACGREIPLPEPMMARAQVKATCDFPPPPPPTQLSADVDFTGCMPDRDAASSIAVGLTISSRGNVTTVRMPTGLTPDVASCIERRAMAMEFLVVDPCRKGSTDIDIFGPGLAKGVS